MPAPDFQTQETIQGVQMFVYWTIGTSYVSGVTTFYNIIGTGSDGNTYTGLMTRGRRGEFFTQNIRLSGA